MKRSTCRIGFVWLALVLNVLAPVIGYARLSDAHDPLTVEFCHAGGAQDVVIDLNGNDDATRTHFAGPHCVYCAGFAANFALGTSLPFLPAPVRAPAYVQAVERAPVFARRRIRVAQPRAPPSEILI